MSDTDAPLPAGSFSEWLRAMRAALASHGGMEVACGSCRGCCVSSYYVKVRAHETRAAAAIGEENLEPGPPGNNGSRLMGFRDNGHCLMLREGNCSIYEDRPETCRSYDCRIYTAANMLAGEDKPVINQRIARWQFTYDDDRARAEHNAVIAAANYLRQHPVRFPSGRIPSRPSEIAVLAVKAYAVFLDPPSDDADIRAGLIKAVQEFNRDAS
jgi:Fe-S-cluster containining protein